MSIKKQGYRTSPIIERSHDDMEKSPVLPKWMKDFVHNIEKAAVQPSHQDQSLFDQISSVMNGTKSKYPNVDAAVKDMQERSGLLAYKNKVDANKIDVKKLAQQIENAKMGSADLEITALEAAIEKYDGNVHSAKEAEIFGSLMGLYDAENSMASDVLSGLKATQKSSPDTFLDGLHQRIL
jgi:hypothetical protein